MTRTTIYNVGHGDAILIHLPDGKKIIRDFGKSKNSRNKGNSISEAKAHKCLRLGGRQGDVAKLVKLLEKVDAPFLLGSLGGKKRK